MLFKRDPRLSTAIAAGDVRAYRDMVFRYMKQTYQFFFRLSRDAGTAEKMTAIAFQTVWENPAVLDACPNPKLSMYRLALDVYHSHRDRLRQG